MGCSSDPAGPAFFFFCLSPVSLSRLSPSGDALVFSTLDWSLSWIRPQLAHTPPTGPARNFGGVASLSGSQNRTQGHTGGRVCFSPQNELTPPPKGEGLGIAFLGFVGFALLVHKRLTRLQQHLSGAALVSFPLPGPQNRTQGHTGARLVSPPFPGALLLRQSRQLLLQMAIHRLVDGQDRVKQRPVSRGSVQCPHGSGQGFDEMLVLQLGYVLPHCVGAHARAFSDFPKARVTQVRLPVFTKNQVGVHGNLPDA